MKTFFYLNPKTIILGNTLMIFILGTFAPLFFFFFNDLKLIGVVMLSLYILTYAYIFNNWFLKRVEISDYGVKMFSPFWRYELPWTNINYVGVGALFYERSNGYPWLYFSTFEVAHRNISSKMIGNHFIMLQYRKALQEEVQKYWRYPIKGWDRIR